MAGFTYDKTVQAAFTGTSVNVSSSNVKAALVRGYTPSKASHEFLSDVTGGGGGTIVSTSANLTGKTMTGKVFDANDTLFVAVPAGSACAHVVTYIDSGTPTSSRLLTCHDSGGLPVTPNGLDIDCIWDSGADKIGTF